MNTEKEKLNTSELQIGKKFDTGKLNWSLLPFDVVEEAVKVITFGAMKYEPNNWQGVETERYVSALLRHFTAWRKGEIVDHESGLDHLSHMLTNLIFIIWQEKHK